MDIHVFLCPLVCVFAEGGLVMAKHWPPSSLSLTDEHNLSFQIHEQLQHYEESKPVPVQDNAASLGHEVSYYFFYKDDFQLFDCTYRWVTSGRKKSIMKYPEWVR